MKNRRMNSKVMLTAAVMFLAAGLVSAQPMQRSMEARGERGPMGFIPDLTEEQKESIKAIVQESRKEMRLLHLDIKEQQLALQRLKLEEASESDVNKKIDEIFALKADMAKKKSSTHSKVRSQLTDEQKVVFDRHAAKRKMHAKHASKGMRGQKGHMRGQGQKQGMHKQHGYEAKRG